MRKSAKTPFPTEFHYLHIPREITIVNHYRLELEFATGRTTAAEIEAALKKCVNPAVAYRQQSRESLVMELMSSLNKVRMVPLRFITIILCNIEVAQILKR